MRFSFICFCALSFFDAFGQANFSFNFGNFGQRVCPADAVISLSPSSVTIRLLDASVNTSQTTAIYRRQLNGIGADWLLMVAGLPPGTLSWTDYNVTAGQVWEYQIKRIHGSSFSTGYIAAAIKYDQTNYRGRMILLVANNISTGLATRCTELKKDLTGAGWFVQEIVVTKATGWDSGSEVIAVRQQVQAMYAAAPADDKPKLLFILGHVPVPRSGLGGQTADGHIQNAGARGADTYYADIDGIFTDTGTYNPGALSSPYAVNLPGDFKWDQDIIPSALEMGFGRIDFSDITTYTASELTLTDHYLFRLHNYRQVNAGAFMGNKSAFFLGYDNSNDGSYRSLPAISGGGNVYQNTTALPHPQWVQQNGPFMIYMQNIQPPQPSEWNTYGMDATIYTSDQSYWGFGDVPEGNQYSKIRSILGANSRCIMAIWTTLAINIFHQAGVGESIGMACQQIMDHNTTNQKLEKPSSAYDTPAWWNRTHFDLWGDPAITLFQVYPPASPVIVAGANNSIVLHWTGSTDSDITGYHVYKSASEFGKFIKISGTAPVTATAYTDSDPHFGEWYMIRAVKQQQTGSGIFLNPSQGIFIKNELLLVPLKLNNFTARKIKQAGYLQWETLSEANCIGFEIQRSRDALIWNTVGFQNTKAPGGNSVGLITYRYTDTVPRPGNNFYRLMPKATTGDGELSAVRQLFFDFPVFTVMPNPVGNSMKIAYNSASDVKYLRIFEISGKKVFEKAGAPAYLDMSLFVPGIYVLEAVTADGNSHRQQIEKM